MVDLQAPPSYSLVNLRVAGTGSGSFCVLSGLMVVRSFCHGTGGLNWESTQSRFCSGLHQYQFIDEPKTWGEAQQYCREKFTDLATVDNMEDVAQLTAAAGSGYSGRVWIGLYDKSRSWGWSMRDDGYYGTIKKSHIRWSISQPNGSRIETKLCFKQLKCFPPNLGKEFNEQSCCSSF
uniref:C-type lectin domain-containing protein n=1 Tax=Amphiprion percula TaxID=161767 RepID=A0A3P8TH72_AMPPE